MTTVLEPPTERDLPAGRQTRMRATLMASVQARPRTARRWQVALAAAGVTVAAGVATVALVDDDPQVLAYGGGAVPPAVQRAADRCVEDNRTTPTAAADLTLTNLFQRGDNAMVVFTHPGGIVYCFNSPDTDSRSIADHAATPWLPGPLSIETAQTQEITGDSDWFGVAGRVTARVARVALDHGNGRRTTANLGSGTFALIADGPVTVATAALITYDATGAEIDRRPAWPADGVTTQTPACYTDPTGTVVSGSGTGCLPAEPWR